MKLRIPHPGWLLLAAVTLLSVAVGFAIVFPWYRARQLTAAVEAVDGRVKRIGPEWATRLASHVGARDVHDVLRSRVTSVNVSRGLAWLNPHPKRVDDAWMRHLEGFQDIKELSLSDTWVTDAGLSSITSGGLRALVLHGTQVRGPGLSHVSRVHELDLTDTPMDDEGLKSLKDFHDLTTLDLSGTSVTGTGLMTLGRLPELSTLDLHGCPLQDESLGYLSNSRSLSVLDLSETPVTGEGLRLLAGCTSLTRLFLWRTEIRDEDLATLSRLPNLKRLDLMFTGVSSRGWRNVSGWKGPATEVWISDPEPDMDAIKTFEARHPGCRVMIYRIKSPGDISYVSWR